MSRRKMGVVRLIDIQSGLCAYCGLPFLDGKGKLSPTLDHVWPRSSGRSKVGNVLAVHSACNKRKGKRRPNACELIMLGAINLKRTEGCSGMPAGKAASGIETEGHDHEDGHGAKHESPTAEGGDAHTPPPINYGWTA